MRTRIVRRARRAGRRWHTAPGPGRRDDPYDDAGRQRFPHPRRPADAHGRVRRRRVRVRGHAARHRDRPRAGIGRRSRSGSARRARVRGELLRHRAVLAVASALVAPLRHRGRLRHAAQPRARLHRAGLRLSAAHGRRADAGRDQRRRAGRIADRDHEHRRAAHAVRGVRYRLHADGDAVPAAAPACARACRRARAFGERTHPHRNAVRALALRSSSSRSPRRCSGSCCRWDAAKAFRSIPRRDCSTSLSTSASACSRSASRGSSPRRSARIERRGRVRDRHRYRHRQDACERRVAARASRERAPRDRHEARRERLSRNARRDCATTMPKR